MKASRSQRKETQRVLRERWESGRIARRVLANRKYLEAKGKK